LIIAGILRVVRILAQGEHTDELVFFFSSRTTQPEIDRLSVIFCLANRTDSDGDAGVKSI